MAKHKYVETHHVRKFCKKITIKELKCNIDEFIYFQPQRIKTSKHIINYV